ncbi:MAG: Do family serine endopeptidase [Paracoccaceae bacterium]|nr:Do family serine endopeptidase [Paracoccaceae bacterium]
MPIFATRKFRTSLRAALLASTLAVAGLSGVAAVPAWAGVPPEGYADLVEKVSPAVVFIEVTSKAPQQSAEADALPFGQSSPLDEFMKRFGQTNPEQGRPDFGQRDAPRDGGVMRGLGSGFLISADGEIVTNNHVVEGATSMKVKLQDGREFVAHVVGSDPMTDIALIKLDKVTDLPIVNFGASDALRVGDAVVAVGNPFGLGGTVTSGIVSAMGRNINSGPYDSYIQTDAAINKGNSGGPLFNASGEVVGMNTAIFSPTGGSVGIGFSIPAQTIQGVIAQLRDHGSVTRGWLGVQIQAVTPDLAAALDLAKPEGALVADVQPDSPALAAGLQSGDVIVAVNGTVVDATHGLPTIIAAIASGDTAQLSILRDGKARGIDVTIGTLSPEKLQLASATPAPDQMAAPLGISVEPLLPQLAQQLGLPQDAKGVVISKVAADSPNADRLTAGDVIEEVAGTPVTSPEMLAAALAGVKNKAVVLLKLNRQGTPLFVGADIATS